MREAVAVLPIQDPEVRALVIEMDDYRPHEHTGDRLMALWIAREQARRYMPEEENPIDFADLQVR